jgi:hypothetical protein
MSSHTESVLTTCVSDSFACTTSHEFLGNLLIVTVFFSIILMVVLSNRYFFIVVSQLFEERNANTLNLNILQSQISSVQSNYLVLAFSSGILNSRLYN